MKKVICNVVMLICIFISVSTMLELGYDTDTCEFWKIYLSLLVCATTSGIYQNKDI